MSVPIPEVGGRKRDASGEHPHWIAECEEIGALMAVHYRTIKERAAGDPNPSFVSVRDAEKPPGAPVADIGDQATKNRAWLEEKGCRYIVETAFGELHRLR
ncbi:MAG: hypothetical protein ABFC89_11465 [Methanospirillum sp.]